jgi:apolipoprotein N-acyltransferase
LQESWKLWVAAALAAGLLELPFPLAGPLPVWRSVFAWIGLIPLLGAILSPACTDVQRPLRRSFLTAYLCGVLWYAGNCYWVRDTMLRYGDMPPMAPTLLLLGFSLVLGFYFGIFGLCVALVRQVTGSNRLALAAAPILWTALELAAARITSVPWDQLGYSQVDNALVSQLAPWTGVYGISFLLVAVNALLAGGLFIRLDQDAALSLPFRKVGRNAGSSTSLRFAQNDKALGNDRARGMDGALGFLQNRWRGRWGWGFAGILLLAGGAAGLLVAPPQPAATATAVLVQPNLDVAANNTWKGPEWDQHIADFTRLADEQCKSYIAGIPQTGAPAAETACPPSVSHPDLVVWPEAPAPFFEEDPRFQQAMVGIAHTTQAPLVVGNIGSDFSAEDNSWRDYNSALVIAASGARVGRYDKIHLVPFGEYIPFKRLLFFARKLTGRVSEFTRGSERRVFRLPDANGGGHYYGVFICYEAVFADEVREFAQLGAEVLVNISDDGWYGDTSAPWQHLNMLRMRAIENRRWILRDTNNGVTAVIDPYGRVRQSIPRHQVDALPADFGFRDDVTFYSAHGDVFAWICVVLSLGLVAWAGRILLRQWVASRAA